MGVNSAGLLGKSFNGNPVLTTANLDQWIRPQIPPQGKRNGDEDSQIWDWTVDTTTGQPIYLGEPDDPNTQNYPDTLNGVPGHPFSLITDRYLSGPNSNRPEILFDPTTGRVAWPLLRPHIGFRPPFSPNGHSGAPWLGETIAQPATAAVDPYANRPDALCPSTSPLRHYNIVVIMLPVQLTSSGTVDPNGMIFSLAQDKAAFLSGDKPAEPLAIRGNIGDCIAVTLTNEQQDARVFGGHAKVNLHIHHVQFDTQASDGVITGFSYEQSVRPYQAEDPQLVRDARVGDTSIKLASVAKFHTGAFIGVGLGTESIEILKIGSIDTVNNTITFDPAFRNGVIGGGCPILGNNALGPCPTPPAVGTVVHPAGQWAGVEFIQERWYPDVALDNIFWHDHVDGIHGWGHGAVGMLNIEPNGALYKDPKTGALTDGAGTLTDIIVDQSKPNHSVAPGFLDSSFREWTFWLLDTNPLVDSMINLRAEPFGARGGDPSQRFSSTAHVDPFTPLPRAYVGDPFVIRTISTAPRPETFALDGHRFFWENRFVPPGANAPESSPIDAIHYGISEKFTLILQGGAGGVQQRPGDYLYHNGLDGRFRQGAWGILRVLPGRSIRARAPHRFTAST